MTRDSLFELLKEDKSIKINITIKKNNITLHKIHDTFYRIIINDNKNYEINCITTAIDMFLMELKKLKVNKN